MAALCVTRKSQARGFPTCASSPGALPRAREGALHDVGRGLAVVDDARCEVVELLEVALVQLGECLAVTVADLSDERPVVYTCSWPIAATNPPSPAPSVDSRARKPRSEARPRSGC